MLRQKRPSFDLHEQDIIAKYMNNTERVADLLPSRPYKEIKLELHKLVKRYQRANEEVKPTSADLFRLFVRHYKVSTWGTINPSILLSTYVDDIDGNQLWIEDPSNDKCTMTQSIGAANKICDVCWNILSLALKHEITLVPISNENVSCKWISKQFRQFSLDISFAAKTPIGDEHGEEDTSSIEWMLYNILQVEARVNVIDGKKIGYHFAELYASSSCVCIQTNEKVYDDIFPSRPAIYGSKLDTSIIHSASKEKLFG